MYSGCTLNCLFILIIIQSVKCFVRSRNIANTSGVKLSYRYLFKISMSDRNPGDLSVSIGPNALGLERIEVYSTLGCKYCRMAKFKLEELGLEYHNVDVTEPAATTVDQKRQEARVAHARSRTVPQIYVGAELVGGCDSMLEEIAKGTFFERLDRHHIIASVSESTATTPILHSKTPSSVRLMESIDSSPESVTREGVLNSVKNDLGPEIVLEPSNKEKINPLELSSALQKQALLLTDKFAAMDGSRIDYKKMRTSKEFQEYIILSESLQLCTLSDLSSLSSSSRLSFFVNLYNAMIIHANCVLVSGKHASLISLSFIFVSLFYFIFYFYTDFKLYLTRT
jgi:glutaredoxin